MTPEARLEKILVKAVQAHGGMALKMPAQWYRGIPDRLVLLPGGRVRFVELKAPSGRVRPHQNIFRRRLFNLGIGHDMVTGQDELTDWIRTHLHAES